MVVLVSPVQFVLEPRRSELFQLRLSMVGSSGNPGALVQRSLCHRVALRVGVRERCSFQVCKQKRRVRDRYKENRHCDLARFGGERGGMLSVWAPLPFSLSFVSCCFQDIIQRIDSRSRLEVLLSGPLGSPAVPVNCSPRLRRSLG